MPNLDNLWPIRKYTYMMSPTHQKVKNDVKEMVKKSASTGIDIKGCWWHGCIKNLITILHYSNMWPKIEFSILCHTHGHSCSPFLSHPHPLIYKSSRCFFPLGDWALTGMPLKTLVKGFLTRHKENHIGYGSFSLTS